jgi:hypothetical protein
MMGVTKLLDLASKSLSRCFACCKCRKFLTARATTNRDECLYMRVLAFQLAKCCETALFAINYFIVVAPIIDGLQMKSMNSIQGFEWDYVLEVYHPR